LGAHQEFLPKVDVSLDGKPLRRDGFMLSLKRAMLWVGLGLWLIVQLGLPVVASQAEIYRWQDAQGHRHFSDSPPSDAAILQPPESESQGPSSRPDLSGTPAEPVKTFDGAPSDVPERVASQAGLLWRINVNGKPASYLLGTIHSSDVRVAQLRPTVAQALDQSQQFVMEMEMDTSAIMTFGASMLLTDGRDLKSLLGVALFKQVQSAMADYGMPPALVHQLKPWVVTALLSMPKPDGGMILDQALQQRAAAAGKPTVGLETAEEQLAVFDQLSMDDQIALLKMTLAQLPMLPHLMEALIRAYVADDLNRIAELAAGSQPQGNLETLKRFTFRLIDARNQRMAQRMTPYLQQGGAFVAVGAMHLAGPKGIVQLLQQSGYQIESVP
jgi:uncharacterized protein YbaP (TraB family)